MKIAMELTAVQLSELIRECPKFAQLLDSQRSTVGFGSTNAEQPVDDDPPENQESDLVEPESTRQRGCSLFESQAKVHGLSVRPAVSGEPGDYVVRSGSKTWHIIIVCSKSPRVSVRKQWAGIPNVVIAYVWLNVGRVFLVPYRDALKILGPKAVASPSFSDHGYYTMICNGRRADLMRTYEANWSVFHVG